MTYKVGRSFVKMEANPPASNYGIFSLPPDFLPAQLELSVAYTHNFVGAKDVQLGLTGRVQLG